jgi:hypothetical protein
MVILHGTEKMTISFDGLQGYRVVQGYYSCAAYGPLQFEEISFRVDAQGGRLKFGSVLKRTLAKIIRQQA